MDRYGELNLNWSVGYKGSQLQFVNNVVLVYSCGNILSFIRDNGSHVKSLASHGSGVGPIAICHKISYIAYAETKLNPEIFVINYPTCAVKCVIKGGAILEYRDLAFSTDGKKLVSLSGVPDFHMTLWDCSGTDGVEICSVNVGEGSTKISINPLNWKQISLFGPYKITLWSLEVCGTENLLTPVEVELPEITAAVGATTTPKIPPPTTFVSSDKDLQAPAATSVGLFVPPNMSEVLYKESYDEFVRLKEPMEPRALCWTPKQSIYVGCGGGQLMMVEFDSGCVTVMVNPQQLLTKISYEESVTSTSKSVSTACTAQALLKEGATDCLVLSRRGLFTAGRSGLMQCFDTNNHFCLVDEVELSQPIHQLTCSSFYYKLALGTESGSIYTTELLSPSTTLKLISDYHHTELVGLDVLCPGADRCVTCRRDGNIQVWNVLNGDLVSSSDLNTEVAVVGAASGHVYMISLVTNTPKLKVKRLMHNGPVTAIKHDQAGNFMASISTQGPVFFYSSKPSTKFEVLGYIESVGTVLDISLLSLRDGDSNGQLQAAILSRDDKGRNSVIQFQVDNSILEQKSPELYADLGKKFSSDLIQCTVLDEQVSGLTLAPEGKAFSILNKTSKLAEFTLPQIGQEDFPATLATYKGHDLDCGKVAISYNQKWVASVASDGKLLLRLARSPGAILSSTPHHYQNNGCRDVVFTRDNQYFITIGDSRTITCWKLKYSDYGETKSVITVSQFNKTMEEMEDQHTNQNKILKKEKYSPLDTSVPDKTWFILAQEETNRTEGEEFSEIKTKLNEELSVLREKVLDMIVGNENLPDIERLGRQEFILDTEDYQRMLGEEKQLINNVREEVEFSNLAAMFLKEQIKKECWDKMVVKGKSIKAFQVRTEVTNFPMVARSNATLKELDRIKTLRRIDMMERKIRKEASSELKQTLQPFKSDEMLEDEDMQDRQTQANDKEEVGDPNSLLGSDRSLYGGNSDLLVHQFELHSRVYQKHQITLLEDCIYMVRENFNKEFDEVMRLKINEISRIKEKNVRIAKIISQLKLDDPLVQPLLSELEEPERLLVVGESEIQVERYISPEEEKRLEEAAKVEDERVLAAKGDNPRERALDMMMRGRLEANIEEDLFKDIPRPAYMSKDPAEMSEEEIRMARDFEKKEEAFLEEREKLKKALEAELRKLQASIIQGMEQFDERLQKLFQCKIRTQMVIHQDELKMFHLTCSLVTEKEVEMKIQEFNDLLQEKKVQKIRLGAIISEAKGRVEEVKEQYDNLATEDKEMDRAFKKEFVDCEPCVDQLYKLFRRRPRGQKHKGTSESVVGNPKSQDMFAMRPSSSGGSIVEGGENPVVHPMAELDHSSYMPEGLELYQWERFTLHRHKKVDSEAKVKVLALELAEMHSFLQRRQNEESRIQQEIQDTFKDISKLQEDKVVFDLNLEIQFLLKQGQVEVQMSSFIPDYSGSVMVHRSKIEELNSQIKTLGEAKLNSMLECKDFKCGIRMLEWEKHKMELEEEGLLDKARDIQMMRVTRDLLQRLHERDLFSKDIREKETLENTTEFYKKAHKKSLRENSAVLKDISRQVKAKNAENRELDLKLRELQVSVAERAQIEKLADVAPSEANREQRMREIVMRRKLVETIKSQDEEYSILKSEMERLRMKTFPALVQVD